MFSGAAGNDGDLKHILQKVKVNEDSLTQGFITKIHTQYNGGVGFFLSRPLHNLLEKMEPNLQPGGVSPPQRSHQPTGNRGTGVCFRYGAGKASLGRE